MKKVIAFLCTLSVVLGLGLNVIAAENTTTAAGGTDPHGLFYAVILKDGGLNKTSVINEIRARTGLSLYDAKNVVYGAPITMSVGLNEGAAEELKTVLEGLGAVVELKTFPDSDSLNTASLPNPAYKVVLINTGGNNFEVLRRLIVTCNVGVLEANRLVRSTPVAVKEGLSKELAETIQRNLEALGATVQLESYTTQQEVQYDAVLQDAGISKIAVIKEIRLITGLSLPDAKRLSDTAPKNIKEGISKSEAEQIKTRLEALGARVELKSNALKHNTIYDVYIKTTVKGSVAQIEAVNIRDALILKGLEARVEDLPDKSLPAVDGTENAVPGSPGLTGGKSTIKQGAIIKLYDVVIVTPVERGAEEAKALQTKSNLEGLGIKVEIRERISAAETSPPPPAEEKSAYDVILLSPGVNKINVIRVISQQLGISLMEAKNLADNTPCTIKYGAPTAETQLLKEKLMEAGAQVELR